MNAPNESPSPNEKKLRFASFAIHATRGLVRDQTIRRKTMFAIVLLALLMLFCGSTFMTKVLDAHERPGWFIFYWGVCAWVTMTAVLLAVFDLVLVRAEGRKTRRKLAEGLAEPADSDEEG